MLEVAALTLKSTGMLLVYIFAGYLLRRSNKLPENASKTLSTLTTTLFLPAYNIQNLAQNFTMDKIGQNAALLGYGVLFTALVIGLGRLLAKCFAKSSFEEKTLSYAFAIPNYGYFGYPVIEGVFGSAMLGNVMIFTIPLGIATNTYGYLLFSPEKKLSWKRVLSTPSLIGTIIGSVLGLSGIVIPDFFSGILSGAGSCMSPSSMILAGLVLGKFPLKKLLTGAKSYWLTAVRLIGIPFVLGGALLLLGIRGIYLMVPLTIFSLPLGLNLVVFPESYGLDASDNARMCFVSCLAAVLILPVTFGILTYLAGLS